MKLGIGIFSTLALAALLAGCVPSKGAEPPRAATLRAAVVLAARGVIEADRACSKVVHELELVDRAKARDLAGICATVDRAAIDSLAIAEATLDAYDASQQGRVTCAVASSLDALERVSRQLEQLGRALPPVAVQAMEIAKTFAANDNAYARCS